MISSIVYSNFRLLKAAELPLGPLTLLIGPNGSGKSTALSALEVMATFPNYPLDRVTPVDQAQNEVQSFIIVRSDKGPHTTYEFRPLGLFSPAPPEDRLKGELRSARVFSFAPQEIALPVPLQNTLELPSSGLGLPNVLTRLQDQYPERFDDFNRDLRRWLPEYDRVLLDTPQNGLRAIQVRTTVGGHRLRADQLSHGTLLALALNALCHLPTPPVILGLEEPDRGIHPRLLRDVKDTLLRLTNPEQFGDTRPPVQVIVTTHSPYLVDLFKDDLESIVLTERVGGSATFRRLTDLPNFEEIVADSSLGAAWYSGVLGGVPSAA